MIVDPQVDPAVVAAAVAGPFADDEERCGLPPAPVAARVVGRSQARDEELGERPPAREIRIDEGVDDTGPGQDVALCRVSVARAVPGPCEAAPAGVGGRHALRIHDAGLTLLPEGVGPHQDGQRVHGRRSALEQGQPIGAVGDIRERLGGDGADAGPGPRDA